MKSKFVEEYFPTIFERSETFYKVEKNILLEVAIQDTGGSKTSISLEDFWKQWINETDGFILVYDINNSESMKILDKIILSIKQVIYHQMKLFLNFCFIRSKEQILNKNLMFLFFL